MIIVLKTQRYHTRAQIYVIMSVWCQLSEFAEQTKVVSYWYFP